MSPVETPLVSVVTPVYNGAEFLADCIESVLRQSYSNWEYIIVNNCSKDGTLEIARAVRAAGSAHPRARQRDVRRRDREPLLAFSLMSPAAEYCKVVSADDLMFPAARYGPRVQLAQTAQSDRVERRSIGAEPGERVGSIVGREEPRERRRGQVLLSSDMSRLVTPRRVSSYCTHV